jgi:hypothetical protein
MKNYKIHFVESDREAVLNIISRSNDIVLNQVEPTAAFITIQLDDDDADVMYDSLLTRIDQELRQPEIIVVKPNCP